MLKKLTSSKKRLVAVLLLSTMLYEIFFPTVALALTAGPTAPEATSFEPVDTTDMVNPLTGSFTYNMPLLEVPGPEGGYPLSLSYHAGISPDLEASWVGLGWTLNPGAINRNVNGLPDDFNEVSFSRRDYWAGGEKRDYGASVGFPGGMNVGLTFSQDTYRGFGVGASLGFGLGIFGNNSPFGLSIDLGFNTYGEFSSAMSLNASKNISSVKGMKMTGGIGLSTNFNSISGFTGGGITSVSDKGVKNSYLGATLSTSSLKPSMSVGGGWAGVANNNAGRIQTRTKGFGLTLPLPGLFTIGLSYRYTRYWSDETAIVTNNGILYNPQTISDQSLLNKRSYDTYRLQSVALYSDDANKDESRFQNGAFPDYDNYSVLAQGLGGSIRPHLFQANLYTQNMVEEQNNNRILSQHRSVSVSQMKSLSKIQFRFLNDFSNSYRQGLSDITNINTAPFNTPTYGNDDGDIGYRTQTGDFANNTLAGSRQVVYFTNEEVINGTAAGKGFINVNGTSARGFNRLTTNTGKKQIGGFMITNESGVTYHFALPVYSRNEYNKIDVMDRSQGYSYSATTRNEPYAYTWLLTAITGPDFIDRGTSGTLDDADWGYWVAFDYGKWTNDYHWRNPGIGKASDLEQGYESFSRGTKEVYYLNAVRTRTHVALFEKEIRLDGKGVGLVNDYGGFNENSANVLRLNKVYLMNVADANVVNYNSGIHNDVRTQDLVNNVLDNRDVVAYGRASLEAKAIRVVDFHFDYSLTKNTPNSFKLGNPNLKYGKLTLKHVLLRGKGGSILMPPTTFAYELGEEEGFDVVHTGNLNSSTFTSSSSKLNVGDLLETTGNNPIFCGIVISKQSNASGEYIYYLKNSKGGTRLGVNLRVTKNPPYDKDLVDIWGTYKADLDRSLISENEDLARSTSIPASHAADVWSLRKVQSVTGSSVTISYESSDYSESVYNKISSFVVTEFVNLNNTQTKIKLLKGSLELAEHFAVGSRVDLIYLYKTTPGGYGVRSTGVAAIDFIVSQVNLDEIVVNGAGGQFKSLLSESRVVEGNLVPNKSDPVRKGGGIRVRALAIENDLGKTEISEYNYNIPGTSVSSGTTSYVPVGLDRARIEDYSSTVQKTYKNVLYNRTSNNHLIYAREIPAPGVMYEYVSIEKKTRDGSYTALSSGKSIYKYRVFSSSMFGNSVLQQTGSRGAASFYRNIVLRDFTSNIGDLLNVVNYDVYGRKVSEIRNEYLYDAYESSSHETLSTGYSTAMDQYNHQGLIQERFGYSRNINYVTGNNGSGTLVYSPGTYITMSARQTYPSILKRKVEKDYLNKTEIGTENLSFDFYSGALTESVSNDSYGNRFMTVVFPAYRKYGAMGLRTQNASNKHMLAQEAGSVTYKVNGNNTPQDVVSATVQTWNNMVPVLSTDGTTITQSEIWRKKDSYAWLPTSQTTNGMTAIGNFSDFNFTNPTSSHANWQKTAGITLYNPYSKALEATDINGQHAATRLGYKHSKVTVTGGPAKYREIAFSGAEDEAISGSNATEVLKGNATVTTATAHTGHSALQLANGQTGFSYTVPVNSLTAGRTYTASLWVRPTSGTAHNVKLYYKIGTAEKGASVSTSSTKQAGGWTLVTLTLNGSDLTAGSTLEVGCINSHATAVYADDFRFQPLNAATVAYVYDRQSGELTHILDNNNLYTRYEYDGMGSLKAVYTEQLGRTPFKVQEYGMHYRTYVYKSSEASGVFTRNTCGSGYAGHTVTYVVPAGDQTSTISQEDADAKAQAKVQANGQAYANANAGCELVQREAYMASFRSNPCNSTGQTNGTLWFKNGDFAQIGTIPQDYSVVSGITVYAGSIGEEKAASGWYAGLYSEPGDGSMVRVYEVGFNGELTRYILCPTPSTPPVVGGNTITATIFDMNMPEQGVEPDRMLTISSSRTYSVPITVSGRVAIVDADGQFELVGGTNFSALIPAGSTYTSQQIAISLEMVGMGNVKVQIKNLTCSPANPDGQTVQLIGNEYIPSQQDSY